MMGPNDVCRLKNAGSEPWLARYANQQYRIQPGGEGIAPFVAVCNWFGHPDAVDISPRDRYRTNERDRLRIKYGVYDDDSKWEAQTPSIEVFTLDGERIITVLDDPDGVNLSPSTSTLAEKAMLEQQMAEMQKQMKAMQTALDVQSRNDEAVNAGSHIEEDAGPNPIQQPPPIKQPTPIKAPSEDSPTRVRVGSPRPTGG